jgi:murein DD-endopeptidase MepM/ murein hydrolase activator NlpD
MLEKNKFNFKQILINIAILAVVLVLLSNINVSTKEKQLMEENRLLYNENKELYSDNKELKEILNEKIPEILDKKKKINELEMTISPNNSFFINNDLMDIDKVKNMLLKNEAEMDGTLVELNKKMDSIHRIPVFFPISVIDLNEISDQYGWRKHPVKKKWIFHEGVDITAKKKTAILATADGVVIKKVKTKYGYGNMVVIDHNNGYKTLYAHMLAFNVRIGDTVKRGDIIGFMGATGLTTGVHLHYEVILNNKPINPNVVLYTEIVRK